MSKKAAIQKELDLIAKKHNGLLRPEDVVAAAEKNKKSVLYTCLEWSDTKAAKEYRLWQAREIIMVHVTVLRKDTKPTRVYVSMMNDRIQPGGGYRSIEVVLSNKILRNQFLIEALAELKRIEAKYNQLEELAGVFAAIRKVRTNKRKSA